MPERKATMSDNKQNAELCSKPGSRASIRKETRSFNAKAKKNAFRGPFWESGAGILDGRALQPRLLWMHSLGDGQNEAIFRRAGGPLPLHDWLRSSAELGFG